MITINKRKIGMYSWGIIRTVLIVGISFMILYPLLAKMCLSFMQEKDLYDTTIVYIPKHFTLENFKYVFKLMNYAEAGRNTLVLGLVVSIIQMLSCTIVGYGFARFRFKGKNLWFGLVILTLIVPPQLIMTPLFLHFRYFDIFGIIEGITGGSINLIDTYIPFVLMSMGCMGLKNGLYIFLTRQFFRGLPKELEEAAYVDGSNTFKTFILVMIPNAIPIMISCFIFSFVWQWTDIFYTSNFLQNKPVLASTLSGLPGNFVSKYTASYGIGPTPAYQSMIRTTGVLWVIIPLLIIYLFTQKYFVESIQSSGIKM